jgi:hypothetical protein
VLLSCVGAGLIIAGLFYPTYIYKLGATTIPLPTDFDNLKGNVYAVLAYPLVALASLFSILWSYRSSKMHWWTTGFGAILLFNTFYLLLLLPSYLLSHTGYTTSFALGFYLKESGYLVAGIGALYAARLIGMERAHPRNEIPATTGADRLV